MSAETKTIAERIRENADRKPTGWLREQRETIRARGNKPIEWNPITIKGEPLSVTIIRERRGDFDDDPLP